MKIKLTRCILFFSLFFCVTGCQKQLSEEETIEKESVTDTYVYGKMNNEESIAFEKSIETDITEKESFSEKVSSDFQEKSMENQESLNEKDNKIIDVKPLCQYPELSTGCEITSLAMVMNYYGIDVDKCDLADNYLNKGPVGTVDFHIAFEGNPRDANSYGCYAPVIKNTADKYFSKKNYNYKVSDVTGMDLEDLFTYIDKNIPVIVWGTLDCRQGHYSVTWKVDGKELTWFTPEHCRVLVGYDYKKSLVWTADPVHGDIRSYDMAIFEDRYNSLKKQAVVIQKGL